MKKNTSVRICSALVLSLALAGCSMDLTSLPSQEKEAAVQTQVLEAPVEAAVQSAVAGSVFTLAGENFNAGLHWYRMDAANGGYLTCYDSQKPTMIFVHGFAWSSGTISDKKFNSNLKNDFTNQGSGYTTYYKGWNLAMFNWKDANNPKDGYEKKAENLADEIKKLISQQGMNNSEIRLVSYSWGIHVVAPAAKKILSYVRDSGKKILVSIDFLDPTTEWGFLEDSIRGDLEWVTDHQVVALKPGKKLIGLSVRKNFGFGSGEGWDNGLGGFGNNFALKILPSINQHMEFYGKESDHWSVLEKYHDKAAMKEPRISGNSWTAGYSRGSTKIDTTWIEAKDWNFQKGPSLGSEFHDVQHHWQKWYIKKYGYWKDVYWYSYEEYYWKGWDLKHRTKKVYRKEWVPDQWDWCWEPYAWKDKVLGYRIWNFMN